MDDYRDYAKAIGALREGKRFLEKATTANKEMKMRSLDQKIANVERFIEAKTALQKGDSGSAARICQALLEAPGIGESLRLGDVFSTLIELYYSANDYA